MNAPEPMSRDDYIDILVRSVVLQKIHIAREDREHENRLFVKNMGLFVGCIILIKLIF